MHKYKLGGLLGFLFETTLTATKMVFDGVFEKFPDIVLILSHFGATLPFIFNRLDDGFKGFPEIRENISKLPSEYLKTFTMTRLAPLPVHPSCVPMTSQALKKLYLGPTTPTPESFNRNKDSPVRGA